MTTFDPAPHIDRLWARAQGLLAGLIGRWAWPDCVAAQEWLTPQERNEILSLLRPVEIAARFLLVLCGAARPEPFFGAPRRSGRSAPLGLSAFRTNRPLSEDHSSWRVAFRLGHPERSGGGERTRASLAPTSEPAPGPARFAAAPLARRIEAVLRVIEDPTAYAATHLRGPRPAAEPTPAALRTRDWLAMRAAEIGIAEAEAFLAAQADTS